MLLILYGDFTERHNSLLFHMLIAALFSLFPMLHTEDMNRFFGIVESAPEAPSFAYKSQKKRMWTANAKKIQKNAYLV